MFEYDICICGNADLCPHKSECERAIDPGPGIFTMGLFYEENEECKYFIQKESNTEINEGF